MKSRARTLRSFAAIFALALTLFQPGIARAKVVDLTVEITGDLALLGGVLTLYPLPVPPEGWPVGADANAPIVIRLDARYSEIQLRHPVGGSFDYRFKSIDTDVAKTQHPTDLLSIVGTDGEGQGPQMKAGFKGAYSSGGLTIRVPPAAEYAGGSEAERSNARWGITEGHYPPPPADERSARVLEALVGPGFEQPELSCSGNMIAQVCVIPKDKWPEITAHWWRQLAESRLDRLRDRALSSCYGSFWLEGGQCDPDPTSNEPKYFKR